MIQGSNVVWTGGYFDTEVSVRQRLAARYQMGVGDNYVCSAELDNLTQEVVNKLAEVLQGATTNGKTLHQTLYLLMDRLQKIPEEVARLDVSARALELLVEGTAKIVRGESTGDIEAELDQMAAQHPHAMNEATFAFLGV